MTLRALTIYQPWAAAIAIGAKDIENRPGPMWKHRGPLGIHAGARIDLNAMRDRRVVQAFAEHYAWPGPPDDVDRPEFTVDTVLGWAAREHLGVGKPVGVRCPLVPAMAVVAVADLTDVHRMDVGCCQSVWRQTHGGVHLVLGNVRALPEPVPCKGAQGMWFLPDSVEAAVRAAVPVGDVP